MQETRETWALSWGRENPLEEGVATHAATLAWVIPRTEEPGGLVYRAAKNLSGREATQHSTHRETWQLKAGGEGVTEDEMAGWHQHRETWQLKVGGEGVTEDETAGWRQWLNERKFEQTPGDSEG